GQDRDRAEQVAAGEAHGVHPRRADHRPAPGGRRAAVGVVEPAGGRRSHGAPDPAPPGRDQDGRPRDRPGTGGPSRGRRGGGGGGGGGDAGRRRRVPAVAHGALPQGAPAGVVADDFIPLLRSGLQVFVATPMGGRGSCRAGRAVASLGRRRLGRSLALPPPVSPSSLAKLVTTPYSPASMMLTDSTPLGQAAGPPRPLRPARP